MQYTYTQSGKVGTLSYQEKGGDIRTYSYTYDKDEKPTKAVYPDKSYTTWTYDSLRRNTKAVYAPTQTAKDAQKLYTVKTYKASNLDNNGATKNATTAFVSTYTNQFGSSGAAVSAFNYTYDNWSNIKSITNQSGKTRTYTYNNFGEVSSATEQYNNGTGKTYVYTYDAGGNILTENVNGTTSTYTYGNSTWKDLLTGYTTGGHTYAVTYDGARHPLNYLGAAMTWDDAGKLASIQKGTNPFLPSTTGSVTYTYLANGQRRTKTVGSQTTTYRYNNGLLLSQKAESTGSSTGTSETLSFTYDTDGKPVSITYKQGSNASVTYFYAYNGQGDVIALYNSSNSALVGSYEYDLWGKLISVTPASATSDPNGILTKNPFRYRGYYYDEETGFYYLNARYYDPQMRRFISADDMAYLGADGSITGFNLFAYCDNNPINGFDNEGTLSQKNCIKLAVGAAFLVGAIALTVATGGGAAVVAVGVAKVVGSVAFSTAVGAGIGYATNGKQGAIDGACDGFLWGSVSACGGAALKYAKVKGIGVHKGASGSGRNKLALGLSENLDTFASSNGASTWKDFSDITNWKNGVLDALYDSNTDIIVNLDGVDNPLLSAQRAASGYGGATDWELLQIKLTPESWDRITWYLEGKIVSNPFAH